MAEIIEFEALVPEEYRGQRLDQVAAQLFPDYSRSRLQGWIKSGELTVNGSSDEAPGEIVFWGNLILAG